MQNYVFSKSLLVGIVTTTVILSTFVLSVNERTANNYLLPGLPVHITVWQPSRLTQAIIHLQPIHLGPSTALKRKPIGDDVPFMEQSFSVRSSQTLTITAAAAISYIRIIVVVLPAAARVFVRFKRSLVPSMVYLSVHQLGGLPTYTIGLLK